MIASQELLVSASSATLRSTSSGPDGCTQLRRRLCAGPGAAAQGLPGQGGPCVCGSLFSLSLFLVYVSDSCESAAAVRSGSSSRMRLCSASRTTLRGSRTERAASSTRRLKVPREGSLWIGLNALGTDGRSGACGDRRRRIYLRGRHACGGGDQQDRGSSLAQRGDDWPAE